jgi:hypothetical protein
MCPKPFTADDRRHPTAFRKSKKAPAGSLLSLEKSQRNKKLQKKNQLSDPCPKAGFIISKIVRNG